MSELLRVSNYDLLLRSDKTDYKVVSDVELFLDKGEIAGLIGESGSGKSMLWKGIFGLADRKYWKSSGSVAFAGEELNTGKTFASIMGKAVSVILQDPMNAFDQVFTIKYHFLETAKAHGKTDKKEILEKAEELLRQLYIKDPKKVLNMYPFQCSGGMLQRIMITIALMMDAELIVADEPTTSVDVTVQREILAMLRKINETRNTGILYISHDIETVESLADKVYVMYAGYLVEEVKTQDLAVGKVCHPYTDQLLRARPSYTKEPLFVIPGNPPTLSERQAGCPFAPRCTFAAEQCRSFDMKNEMVEEGHRVRCCRWREFV